MGALENDLNPDVSIGLSLPLGHSDSGFFEQTQTTLKQTSTNIKNLLLTMKGERPFLPEFGCDIYSALFEPIGDETTAKIEDSIKDAIAQWLPHVVLNRVDVNVDMQVPNQINVDLEFGVTIEPEALETIQLVFVSQF
jgi:phage baseplate assembly protein W|tara:strand:+ start:147 stop:560 length:414 start_codon:yes stop_codon:yes gene_type:complete